MGLEVLDYRSIMGTKRPFEFIKLRMNLYQNVWNDHSPDG